MTVQPFKFSYHPGDVDVVCGLDVHKHELTAAVETCDAAGEWCSKLHPFKTTPEGIAALWKFVSKYQPRAFVMEATGVYHHVVAQFLANQRVLAGWAFEVVVVNPADAAGIPGRPKNDRVDASRLARYHAAGLFPVHPLPVPVLEDLKALFRAASRLEVARTQLKNRVKKTLDRAGIRPVGLDLNADGACAFLLHLTDHPGPLGDLVDLALHPTRGDGEARPWVARHAKALEPFRGIALSQAKRAVLRQDLVDLDFQTSRKALLAVEVDAVVGAHPGIRYLVHCLATIPGLSPFSAAWLLAEVGPVARFPTRSQFLSFCGVAPQAKSSANNQYSNHLSRRSNKYLRVMLYQAAIVVCFVVKKDSALKRYAKRALARHPGKQRKLAVVQVANKIARVVFAIFHARTVFVAEPEGPRPVKQPPKGFSVADRKILRRARNCLRRVTSVEEAGVMLALEAERLAEELDQALGGQNTKVC